MNYKRLKVFTLRGGFAPKFLFESSKKGLNLEKSGVDKGCQNELISLTFLIKTTQYQYWFQTLPGSSYLPSIHGSFLENYWMTWAKTQAGRIIKEL